MSFLEELDKAGEDFAKILPPVHALGPEVDKFVSRGKYLGFKVGALWQRERDISLIRENERLREGLTTIYNEGKTRSGKSPEARIAEKILKGELDE